MRGKITFVEAKKFENMSPIEVKININTKEIKKIENNVTVIFSYDVQYTPNIGYIRFIGEISTTLNREDNEYFEKTNKIPGKTMQNITNSILHTCTVQSIIISTVLQLPPPINLPAIALKQEKNHGTDIKQNTSDNPTYIG